MTDRDERLKHLAELASNEQDLQKFNAIVREITLILEEKQERLGKMQIPSNRPSDSSASELAALTAGPT
jgi:hypothetical protein